MKSLPTDEAHILFKDFLERFFRCLDKYLFQDLDTLASSNLDNLYAPGRLNFPLLLTTMSAMELLGKVLTDQSLKNASAFMSYWENFFLKTHQGDSRYTSDLGKLFYDAIRHGCAHYFLVKSGIQVSKSTRQDDHLTVTKDRRLNVNALALYKDFLSSYQDLRERFSKNPSSFDSYIGYNNFTTDLDKEIKTIHNFLNEKHFPNTPTASTGSPAYEENLPGTMADTLLDRNP